MSKMQLRTNRTTNNPGLVDLPNKRRSGSDVAAETSKKKEAAAAKASKRREQEARVADLEREVKTAQREVLRARVKKTFPALQIDEVEEVSSCCLMYRAVFLQFTSPSSDCRSLSHLGHPAEPEQRIEEEGGSDGANRHWTQ